MPARQPGDPIPKGVIRQIRQRHGLSQDAFARRLGLKGGKSVISGWENGHSTCEGPAAELLLLLFGENQTPIAQHALHAKMEERWKRAGNFFSSCRQVSAIPESPLVVEPTKFARLFPGAEIPPKQHTHGFPFLDHDLPKGVYGLSGRWIGAIPIEQERPPGYLWMLARDGAFAYREGIWEDRQDSVTVGHTHIGSLLHIALSLVYFLRRLGSRLSFSKNLRLRLNIDLHGMLDRSVVAYRLDRKYPDVVLDGGGSPAVEDHLSGSVSRSFSEIELDPLGAGFALVEEIANMLRPDLASNTVLEDQLRRRHSEDIQHGNVRFLGFLDEVLKRQPRKGIVSLSGQRVGVLEETVRGSLFTYDPDYLKKRDAVPLSPTIPLDAAPYQSIGLHPFFSNLLLEGSRLELASKNLRLDPDDRFGILLELGSEMIGAVEVRRAHENDS